MIAKSYTPGVNEEKMRNAKIVGVHLRSEGRISTLMPPTNLGLGVGKKKLREMKSLGKVKRKVP